MPVMLFNFLFLFLGTFLLSTIYYDIINVFKNYHLKIKGSIISVGITDDSVFIQVKWKVPSGYTKEEHIADVFLHQYKLDKKFKNEDERNDFLNKLTLKNINNPFYLSAKVFENNILDIKKTTTSYIKIFLNVMGLLFLALLYQYFKPLVL